MRSEAIKLESLKQIFEVSLEAVVDQLYVVGVIAWLVGNYVRQKRVS